MFPQFNKFFSPDDAVGTGGESESDTFELLSEEEPAEEVLEIGKSDDTSDISEDDEEKDEEPDELKEIEEELVVIPPNTPEWAKVLFNNQEKRFDDLKKTI